MGNEEKPFSAYILPSFLLLAFAFLPFTRKYSVPPLQSPGNGKEYGLKQKRIGPGKKPLIVSFPCPILFTAWHFYYFFASIL